jgi:hypothetical protein
MKKPSSLNRGRKGASKKIRAKKAKRSIKQSAKRTPATAAIAPTTVPPTLAKVLAIIGSYGIVVPAPATIVGPAVPSMGQFTNDVNGVFGRSYVLGRLKSIWTANQTSIYIDDNP